MTLNRRSFLSFFGLAPAAAFVMPKVTLQLVKDMHWTKTACERLRNSIEQAFPDGQVRCTLVLAEMWELFVHTEDREIHFSSDVRAEDAIVAVKLMLGGGPGRYSPIYAGGRVRGVTETGNLLW